MIVPPVPASQPDFCVFCVGAASAYAIPDDNGETDSFTEIRINNNKNNNNNKHYDHNNTNNNENNNAMEEKHWE
ncbi:hypothetical protein HPP92_024170 [Vanilla planifolia]|uniref:Uncharacterized protein n=1 Tax=Vanilla planifolia TaxID=51239 RepID=A0A835PJS1_VANPL|nr:hypothetical protein HPP92_024503 [Vanilla planifolia]KAG0456382.1 hypothetical protein HPP92_024170 [Vanilla planifolia]